MRANLPDALLQDVHTAAHRANVLRNAVAQRHELRRTEAGEIHIGHGVVRRRTAEGGHPDAAAAANAAHGGRAVADGACCTIVAQRPVIGAGRVGGR